MMLKIAMLIGLAATLGSAASKNREWQTGTLLDPQHNEYFGGNAVRPADTMLHFGDPRTGSQLSVGNSPTDNFVLDRYVVESETDVYLVQVMRLATSKAYSLSAGMPLKFAVDKKKLWMMDGEGVEHQTTVVKRKPKFQATQ